MTFFNLTHVAAGVSLAVAAALPAHAISTTFITSLSNIGEAVATSTATGAATVTFDDLAGTVAVNVSWNGLLGAAPFGHIHCCTATPFTGNSGVAIGFASLTNAATGSYTDTFTPSAATFANLLAGTTAGQAYVNIHTPGTYGGGEIRGFLAPIPEPSTYALMLAGLAAVAFVGKRRRVTDAHLTA